MLIQNMQSDIKKQLDDYISRIRTQNMKEFRNQQFGAKLLEVMAESYQLIFQQKKNAKFQVLTRIKEQYEEFLVRKIRKLYILELKQDPIYILMNANLKILENDTQISLDWWAQPNNKYKNVFEYLTNRYFNIMGIIKYELMLR